MKKFPRPLYFAGISPSDIFLFGKIRTARIRQEVSDEIGLLEIEIVIQILDGTSDEELQADLRSWIEYVQNIIHINGDHIS
jgi:hypothetical protein